MMFSIATKTTLADRLKQIINRPELFSEKISNEQIKRSTVRHCSHPILKSARVTLRQEPLSMESYTTNIVSLVTWAGWRQSPWLKLEKTTCLCESFIVIRIPVASPICGDKTNKHLRCVKIIEHRFSAMKKSGK